MIVSTNAQTSKGHMCSAEITGGQTLNTAWVKKDLTFGGYAGDTDYFTVDSSSPHTSVTVKKAGVYLINFILSVSNLPTSGARLIPVVSQNNNIVQILHYDTGEGDGSIDMCVIITASTDDVIRFGMNGNNTSYTTNTWSRFQIAYLGGS